MDFTFYSFRKKALLPVLHLKENVNNNNTTIGQTQKKMRSFFTVQKGKPFDVLLRLELNFFIVRKASLKDDVIMLCFPRADSNGIHYPVLCILDTLQDRSLFHIPLPFSRIAFMLCKVIMLLDMITKYMLAFFSYLASLCSLGIMDA